MMDGAQRGAWLQFAAGSTLFASGYDAYELAPETEQQVMLTLQARYSRGWGSLTNVAGQHDEEHDEDRDGDGPLMDLSGTRRLRKPWYANDTANAKRFDCVLPLVLRHQTAIQCSANQSRWSSWSRSRMGATPELG